MISFDAIKRNSRLTQFEGTKELVIMNSVPKVQKQKIVDVSVQRNLFEF